MVAQSPSVRLRAVFVCRRARGRLRRPRPAGTACHLENPQVSRCILGLKNVINSIHLACCGPPGRETLNALRMDKSTHERAQDSPDRGWLLPLTIIPQVADPPGAMAPS